MSVLDWFYVFAPLTVEDWLVERGRSCTGGQLLHRCQCDNLVRFLAFDSGAAGRMEMPGKARIITEWMPKTLLDVKFMCKKYYISSCANKCI
jgi:hypothetical protein